MPGEHIIVKCWVVLSLLWLPSGLSVGSADQHILVLQESARADQTVIFYCQGAE